MKNRAENLLNTPSGELQLYDFSADCYTLAPTLNKKKLS